MPNIVNAQSSAVVATFDLLHITQHSENCSTFSCSWFWPDSFFRLFPTIAATLNLGVLIFTTQWHPALDSLVPYFIVTGIWGISDGIWISQVNILMGVVFPEKYEEAFAGLRVIQGLGAAISFAYSNSLCMAYKIYIVGAICLVSVALYLAMEAILRRRTKSKIVMLKQTPV